MPDLMVGKRVQKAPKYRTLHIEIKVIGHGGYVLYAPE